MLLNVMKENEMKELTNYERVIKVCEVLKETHEFYSEFLKVIDALKEQQEEILKEFLNAKPKLNNMTDTVKFLEEYKRYYIQIHSSNWKKRNIIRSK